MLLVALPGQVLLSHAVAFRKPPLFHRVPIGLGPILCAVIGLPGRRF